ncbi:MAG TPA: glycosyltransferase [Methylocella sp.]|nr:glycosyltransferase [Methylocella sp.]
MKLLRVIGSAHPEAGGPVESILIWGAVLKEHGCSIEVLSLDSPLEPWIESFPLKLYPMGLRNPRHHKWQKKIPWARYGYTPHFVPWLKENASRYDAIIIDGFWEYTALGSWRALRNSQTPFFVFAHGMLDPYFIRTHPVKAAAKQIFWWLADGRLAAHAENVFFTSEEECRLAQRSFWPFRGRGRIIPYGIADAPGDAAAQIESFRAAVPELGGRPFLLFLSRIHPKKGCDLLIRAFAEAAGRHPGLDLVMAGPDSVGWATDLRQMAAKLGVSNRIHWPGMLKGSSKWGAFRAAEAFVLPSHQENFGTVVAEAMACGTPVLTTDKVNIWREVEASGAGLIAQDHLEGVKRLLNEFLSLPAADKMAMGARARQGFLGNFDLAAMAPQILQALKAERTPLGLL